MEAKEALTPRGLFTPSNPLFNFFLASLDHPLQDNLVEPIRIH